MSLPYRCFWSDTFASVCHPHWMTLCSMSPTALHPVFPEWQFLWFSSVVPGSPSTTDFCFCALHTRLQHIFLSCADAISQVWPRGTHCTRTMQWFYCYGYDHFVNLRVCCRLHLIKQLYSRQLLYCAMFIIKRAKRGGAGRGVGYIGSISSLVYARGEGYSPVQRDLFHLQRGYKCISKFHC